MSKGKDDIGPPKDEPTGPDAATDSQQVRKTFNPWRFGFHTVSPELSERLMKLELPDTPDEDEFFRSGASQQRAAQDPESNASPPPPLTVDASAGGTERAKQADSRRMTDSVVLRRRQVPHPLRLAAPWAVLAAALVLGLLWLLTGHRDQSETGPVPSSTYSPQVQAAQSAVPLGDLATPPPASEQVVPSQPPTRPDGAPHEPETERPPSHKKQAAARTAGVAKPATPAASTPAASSPPVKPKEPTTSSDATSPFGKWTIPPTD